MPSVPCFNHVALLYKSATKYIELAAFDKPRRPYLIELFLSVDMVYIVDTVGGKKEVK